MASFPAFSFFLLTFFFLSFYHLIITSPFYSFIFSPPHPLPPLYFSPFFPLFHYALFPSSFCTYSCIQLSILFLFLFLFFHPGHQICSFLHLFYNVSFNFPVPTLFHLLFDSLFPSMLSFSDPLPSPFRL